MSAYKKFVANVLNPKHKQLRWYNHNLYYFTTIAVIGALCLCWFVFRQSLDFLVNQNQFWNVVFMPLRFADVGDLVGNIIGFAVVSFFLERHFGSFKYFMLVILSIVPSSVAVFAFTQSWAWVGFGSVLFFLIGIFALVLILNFRGYFLGQFRWIFPVIMLGLVALVLCWDGSASQWPQVFIHFGCFTNLVKDASSWAPCLMGGIVGLFAQMCFLGVKRRGPEDKDEKTKDKKFDRKLKNKDVVMLGDGKVLVEKKKNKYNQKPQK